MSISPEKRKRIDALKEARKKRISMLQTDQRMNMGIPQFDRIVRSKESDLARQLCDQLTWAAVPTFACVKCNRNVADVHNDPCGCTYLCVDCAMVEFDSGMVHCRTCHKKIDMIQNIRKM